MVIADLPNPGINPAVSFKNVFSGAIDEIMDATDKEKIILQNDFTFL